MKKVVLISCASKKLSKKAEARDLYISPLFKYNIRYAKSLNPEKIFILSAKYGLLELNEEVEPYNQTLNKMGNEEIVKWADEVINKLSKKTDLKKDEFTFLAGEKYRKFLIHHMSNYKIPLEGLGIGKQLKYLKERVKDEQ
mgnify:CR=1 FL=1